MLIEINKPEIDNFDVRTAIKTLRDNGAYAFQDGYYHSYLTCKQYDSLMADPRIANPFMTTRYFEENPDRQPAIYGAIFFKQHNDNQPAKFYGSSVKPGTEIELVKVNP